jgi:hypothetical protein
MDRFVTRRKRRKLDTNATATTTLPVPAFYKDFWTLVVRHLDWPELYALTKVARKPRKAALPVLLQAHAEDLRIHVLWKLILYDRRVTPFSKHPPYHLWHLRGFEGRWFATSRHPRLVNNTTLFGLLYDILYKLRKSKNVGRVLGQPFLRFARITGITKGPPFREWYLNKED